MTGLPIVNAPPIRPGRDWFLYVKVETPDGGERPVWGAHAELELADDYGDGTVVARLSVVVCAAQEGEFALSLTGFETQSIDARNLRGVLVMVNSESEREDVAELVIPVEGAAQ